MTARKPTADMTAICAPFPTPDIAGVKVYGVNKPGNKRPCLFGSQLQYVPQALFAQTAPVMMPPVKSGQPMAIMRYVTSSSKSLGEDVGFKNSPKPILLTR
jgi:hypothetical protein